MKHVRIPGVVLDDMSDAERVERNLALERDGEESVAYLLVVIRILVAYVERERARSNSERIVIAECRSFMDKSDLKVAKGFVELRDQYIDLMKAVKLIRFYKFWVPIVYIFVGCFIAIVPVVYLWLKMKR